MSVFQYKSVKLLYRTMPELMEKINSLHASKILSVEKATPDETTTAMCVSVYYEYMTMGGTV